MGIAPLSNDNIKVGYITDDGYVSGVSLAAANEYEKLNPETVFIFINGDKKVKYLTIDEVNALTTTDLLRSDPCNVGPTTMSTSDSRVFWWRWNRCRSKSSG